MSLRRLPPLHAIRAFEAAARHLSITRAAEELHVTAGAVSRHVRALESEMRTLLFQRRSTGLVLTAAGEALAAVTRDALDGIANAVSGIRLRRYRRLSVGVYGFFVSRALLPHWPSLRAHSAELEIDLHTSSNALDLMPGHYDAIIAVSDGTPRTGAITRRLLPISTIPVCTPDWMQDGRIDFATIPLLHSRPRPDDWRRWLDHVGLGTVGAEAGSSFESVGLAMEAAAAGLGAAMAIEALLAPDLESGALICAHARARPTRRHFVLQYDGRLADDPAMKAFEDWLMAKAAEIAAAAPSAR